MVRGRKGRGIPAEGRRSTGGCIKDSFKPQDIKKHHASSNLVLATNDGEIRH